MTAFNCFFKTSERIRHVSFENLSFSSLSHYLFTSRVGSGAKAEFPLPAFEAVFYGEYVCASSSSVSSDSIFIRAHVNLKEINFTRWQYYPYSRLVSKRDMTATENVSVMRDSIFMLKHVVQI